MSKITFRADDELVDALESFEASKSEVMRQALREYLESHPDVDVNADGGNAVNAPEADENERETIDDLIAERVDELVEERFEGAFAPRTTPQDVNVNITLDGDSLVEADDDAEGRMTTDAGTRVTSDDGRKTCDQCGENVGSDHVYCPNCGEKATHRVFCECGDELRSDWAFCPSCGRRTAAADVLDSP